LAASTGVRRVAAFGAVARKVRAGAAPAPQRGDAILEGLDCLARIGKLLLERSIFSISELRTKDDQLSVLVPGECRRRDEGNGQQGDQRVLWRFQWDAA
jgi:hypothetical protein